MKLACVTSIQSVGCTFVDWSLHFLSNQTNYYRLPEQSSILLVDTPMTKINAHGHRKNHPSGFKNTKEYIQHFRSQSNFNFCSMYPLPMHVDTAMQHLDVGLDQLSNTTVWKKVIHYISDDYQKLINYCCEQKIGTIYIDPDPKLNLYFLSVRSLDRLMLSDRAAINDQELMEEYQNTFFQSAISQWQTQGLTNTWDIRERQALNSRPFDRLEDQYQLKLTLPHLWINSSELWNHGVDTIQRIMEYLDLPVDSARWNQWLPVYYQWQELQQKILKFAYQFDHIIDAIVNNYYYKLEKLSFGQEVAIQHALIYQHNLNLKTWQLNEFPSNTQDLHQLLEPNIHPI